MTILLQKLIEHRPPRQCFYLSWYKDARPWLDEIQYLAKSEDDCGFYYVRDKARAHRFETFAEAQRATPVYDGSAFIEERTGVTSVYV